MYDSRTARENMIHSQLRPNRVYSRPLLEAMFTVQRELFVPQQLEKVAYIDEDITLTENRYLIEPTTFARLVQAAAIDKSCTVLDIGCASGYSAAVLSLLAKSVVAVEENPDLFRYAQQRLAVNTYANVTLIQNSHAEGAPGHGPFDVIFIGGLVEHVPDALLNQLAPNGRLVTVIADDGIGRAATFRKAGRTLAEVADFDAMIPPMPGFGKPHTFVL